MIRAVLVIRRQLRQVPSVIIDAGFGYLECLLAGLNSADASEHGHSPIGQADEDRQCHRREYQDGHEDVALEREALSPAKAGSRVLPIKSIAEHWIPALRE